MDRVEIIEGLTTDQSAKCLNCMLKYYAERDEDLRSIMTRDASAVIATVATRTVGDLEAQRLAGMQADDARAIREVLLLMAHDPNLADKLDGCLVTRNTLTEPITTALVMAGLVIVLSTHIKVSYEDKDGKKHLKISIDKPGTPKEIIKKIIGVLN